MKIYLNSDGEALEWISLAYDNWDDFGFKTLFRVSYHKNGDEEIDLGSIQIGFEGMLEGSVISYLPISMKTLPDNFFSLGVSEEYYTNVIKLGENSAKKIYSAMKDLAFNLELFNKYKSEKVVTTSLLRFHSISSVEEQLHRIAHGGAILTPYEFKFTSDGRDAFSPFELEFEIQPNSNPPTNIHVVIARNGTGKTYLLKSMIKSLLWVKEGNGVFQNMQENSLDDEEFFCFSNVLCVAFSPFDDYSILQRYQSDGKLPFSYIGLDKKQLNLQINIGQQFINSFSYCMIDKNKSSRWEKAIEFLKSDPAFLESKVYDFVERWEKDKDDNKVNAREFLMDNFEKLSSGHKVVLLIITACVEKLVEKSIIFLDEPENHLHPPLLSAFMRAMSYLLINRNSVAIMSTHSPVVLQEVPRKCVWALHRSGKEIVANRVEMETFGATIGALTREVFGLEVNQSGFIKMLSEDVDEGYSYEEIMVKYNDELGEEARALLQTLLVLKERKDEENK